MIGYKVIEGYDGFFSYPAIATLQIPDDAKKCNPKGKTKWRCDRAKVVKIESIDGKRIYIRGRSCVCVMQGIRGVMYYTGSEVRPLNGFDDDEENECSKGIHYFLTREEAVIYSGIRR